MWCEEDADWWKISRLKITWRRIFVLTNHKEDEKSKQSVIGKQIWICVRMATNGDKSPPQRRIVCGHSTFGIGQKLSSFRYFGCSSESEIGCASVVTDGTRCADGVRLRGGDEARVISRWKLSCASGQGGWIK